MYRFIQSSLIVLFVSTTVFAFSSLFAGDETPGKSVLIDDPWSRPAPPVAVNGAAYISVHNMGPDTDRLISASSEIANMVQIHDHIMDNGLMKMRHLEDGVSIEAGEIVKFKPGGKHLMLMGLNSPLVEGQSFELILQFEKAGEKSVAVEIKEMGSNADHGSHSMEQGG